MHAVGLPDSQHLCQVSKLLLQPICDREYISLLLAVWLDNGCLCGTLQAIATSAERPSNCLGTANRSIAGLFKGLQPCYIASVPLN